MKNKKKNILKFKHCIVLMILLMVSSFNLKAQNVNLQWQDGVVRFKIYNSETISIPNFTLGMNDTILPLELRQLVSQYNITKISKTIPWRNSGNLSKYYSIRFLDSTKIYELIGYLQNVSFIELAEPASFLEYFCTTDASSWSTPANSYHLNLIQACAAFGITQGNTNVRIGITEPGLDINHYDFNFNGNIKVPANGAFDVADNDNNVMYPSPLGMWLHGNHVGGLAAGTTNNNLGIASIGNLSTLMIAKVTADLASTVTPAFGYEGIDWLNTNNANIINCSWGGLNPPTIFEQTVLDNAILNNRIIIASAGNTNINTPTFPAAYPPVVAVAATNQTDNLWVGTAGVQGSNFGPWIDICAPGVDIYSCGLFFTNSLPNSYNTRTGTSMAAPIVSGTCALIWAQNPTFTRAQVINCLLNGANNINASNPNFIGQIGAGRVNAYNSIICANAGIQINFNASDRILCPNTATTFSNTSIYNGQTLLSQTWSFPGGTPNTSTINNPTINYNTPGVYPVTLTCTLANGIQTYTFLECIRVTNFISNFVSNGSVCANEPISNNVQILNALPPYSIVYNVNSGTNQIFSTNLNNFPIYFNTLNPPNITFNYVSYSFTNQANQTITCPINQVNTIPVVRCCNNQIVNGDFQLGNTGFTTSNCINCNSHPGNCSVTDAVLPTSGPFCHGALPVTLPPDRGLSLRIDGPGSLSSIACAPLATNPNGISPGVTRDMWRQSQFLIPNIEYKLSFFALPGINFNPILYANGSSFRQFRLLVRNSTNVIIYTSPTYTLGFQNSHNWYQYYATIPIGSIPVSANYIISIDQFETFTYVGHDYAIDDISLKMAPQSPCSFLGLAELISTPSMPLLPNRYYQLSANLNLTANTNWADIDIAITNPLATITVAPGATLTINRCRLHGCGNMWKGIVVQSGGKLVILNESLIEDAEKAVYSSNASTDAIKIRNTTFNKNIESVVMENLSIANIIYPLDLGQCVFTSRNIPITGCQPPNWTTTTELQTISTIANSLESPYKLQNLPIVALINGNAKPKNHMRFTKVGRSNGIVYNPTLYYVSTNTSDTGVNIYDNATNGIYSDNSNINVSRTNIFQYCEKGVYANKTANVANGASTLKLFATTIWNQSNNPALGNKFFDNIYAIYNFDIAFTKIVNTDIRSTQNISTYNVTANPGVSLPANGYMGIINFTWSNGRAEIINNKIYNNAYGIFYYTGGGNFGATPLNAGNTTISNNIIWDKPTGNTTTTAFCAEAINTWYIDGSFPGWVNHLSYFETRVENNDIKNAFRGISFNGFNYKRNISHLTGNTIVLALDPSNNATVTQHGIWASKNRYLYVKGNNITGNDPSAVMANGIGGWTAQTHAQIFTNNVWGAKGRQANYRLDNNTVQNITCNNSLGGFIGYEFNGLSSGINTKWQILNNMSGRHYYGYALASGAIIGQQGSNISPMNNLWNYTPFGGQTRQTMVVNVLPATTSAVNSKFFVNNNSAANPGLIPSTNGTLGLLGTEYKMLPTNQSIFTTTTTASSTCLKAPTVASPGQGPGPGPIPSSLPGPGLTPSPLLMNDITSLDIIASTGITFAQKNTELNYVGKQYLYNIQKTDSGYNTYSTALSTFYASANNASSQYRKMQDIEDAIGAANYSTAQTLNNAFTPVNTVETNQKNYYNVAISFGIIGTLKESERAMLQSIAMLCPHFEGKAVYDARALYNIYTIKNSLPILPFYDDCNASGLYKKANTINQVSGSSVTLFPNPNNGSFYLDFEDKTINQTLVKIIDATGKVVFENEMKLINGFGLCSNNLSSGIYLIRLSNKNNPVITKKFVVE